jgi:DNA polymerase-4
VILHADLDAFYAAIAQRDDPNLRGKPIVVSGSSRRAVVLTASYEARPFGVRSAMPLYQALERCPQLVVVPPTFDRYRIASGQVFEILRSHALAVEGLSLDEAFLDVGDITIEDATSIARRVKREVREATGLTISIGIAAGKMIAKIASDDGKPDGLVAVTPGTEAGYIAAKPVGRLWGVGPKTQARLHAAGIERIEQIASMSDERAAQLFGRWGAELRQLARGLDDRRVVEDDTIRSISSETTLERDASSAAELLPLVREQAQELAERLARRGLRAQTVGVKIKSSDFRVLGRQTKLANPTDDARIIGAAAALCLRKGLRACTSVRLVGVRVASLVEDREHQLALFGSSRSDDAHDQGAEEIK